MTKPTVEELLQMVDQAITYNAKDAEDFESNVHLQAEMSCVAENAAILATALRERLVGEQWYEIHYFYRPGEMGRRFLWKGPVDKVSRELALKNLNFYRQEHPNAELRILTKTYEQVEPSDGKE
jgi:hypothetical protein